MRTALLFTATFVAFAQLPALPANAADWLYLTVPGDTLSGIGQAYLRNPKDWPKVQSANNVPIPKHLPANSRLKIPVELLKVTPAPVDVVAITGTPRYKGAEGPYRPLQTGATLNGGETVLTGPGASVSYRFADDTRLTQQASSKLNFGRLQSYGKTGMVSTEISLDSGRLEARASKQRAPAGAFQVRTPVAVAGLRGTDFRLNVDEDGKSMRNEVTEGTVAVSAQGQEVRVDAGFGTYAELGKAPSAPVALLPPPDLSSLPANIMRLPLELSWPIKVEVSVATTEVKNTAPRAWRAQLSTDADFQTVLRDEVLTQPSVQWGDDLPDGAYFLRVRGIDPLGLEGLDARHAFSLNARPLPPSPMTPVLGAMLDRNDVDLVWNSAAGAEGYVLQLANTPEFGNGLIERRLPPITQTRETLAEGDWHWRIASLDAQGQARAFSPHRAFRVELPPLPPVPAPVSISPPPQPGMPKVIQEGSALRVTWSGTAALYRLEMSTDETFSQIVAKEVLTSPEGSLSKPTAGNYWLRVIALDKEKRESAPSQAAQIVIQQYIPWWLLLPMIFLP